MRKLIGILLILAVFVAPVRAAIFQNYYTTNQTPVTGGQATNIFVGKSGVVTITTNVAGSIYTVNLSAATVGAITSTNAIFATNAPTGYPLVDTNQLAAAGTRTLDNIMIGTNNGNQSLMTGGAILIGNNYSAAPDSVELDGIKIGHPNGAVGPHGISIGHGAGAGTNSVMVGHESDAFGSRSIAIGSSSFADGEDSIVLGYGSQVDAIYQHSIVLGQTTTAVFSFWMYLGDVSITNTIINGVINGNANGLTNGSPSLATNSAVATDGMALVKRGNKLKLETISGSLPADTSTSSLLTNSASNVKGWLPLASLVAGASTNNFFVTNTASSTGAQTNSYGDSWERRSGGVYNALVIGTNPAAHTVITDDVSEFANGTWVDTSSSGFFFGKVAPSGIGGVAGDLSFGRGFGTTLDTTGDVTVGGNVPVTGIIIGNGRSITNIPVVALYSATNTWGSQTFDFNVAEATTNMAAAITITGLVNTGVGKTNYDHIVRYIIASGSDRTFTPSAGTFVNGVAGAPAFVCTNGQLTTINVVYQGGNFTNLTHVP